MKTTRELQIQVLPTRPDSSDRSFVMLCPRCSQLALCVLDQEFSAWSYFDHGLNASFEYIHNSHTSIVRSASSGCPFCLFFTSVSSSPGNYSVADDDTPVRIACSFPKTEFHLPKSSFNLLAPLSDSVHNSSLLPFEIFQAPEQGPCTTLCNPLSLWIACQISPRPDSPDCIELAKRWMKQCVTSHANCVRPTQSLLPTRVIDVGPKDCSEDPRLVTPPSGACGSYLTLSYCWGKDGHVVTTTKTIDQHHHRIDTGSLPQTLKDAIHITRMLGFRWVWIDALCIVQDDREDWKQEAARMSTVYESATLSLAALDSPGSTSGFLHERHREFRLAQVKDLTVGIRSPSSHAHQRLCSSQLETRAWTLQERVLAPAVLHFGKDQLYWECSAGLTSESHPIVREPKAGASDFYYGRSVHDMKQLLRARSKQNNVDLWNDLVAEYTTRILTNASDRLPAIQGLAAKFSTCSDRSYMRGLWSDALHVGLLWSVSKADRTQHGRCMSGPSWSWASAEASIVFMSKARPYGSHTFHSKAKIIPLPEAGYEQSSADRLMIEGLVQQGVCFVSSTTMRGCDFVTITSDSFFDCVKCTLDEIPPGVRKGDLIEQDFYCFMVAEESLGAHCTKRCFLILSETQIEEDTPAGFQTYKRVGLGWQEVYDGVVTGILADVNDSRFILT